MTYVDGLSTTLDNISQIQDAFASLPTAPSTGGFAAVLAQISALGGASAAPSSGAGQGSNDYGWPLEEGRPLPGASSTAGPSPQVEITNPPVDIGSGSLSAYPSLSPAGATTASMGALSSEGAEGALGSAGADGAEGAAGGEGALGSAPSQILGEQAVTEAEKFLGVPYVWGGTNPAVGVDCSGLVQDVYGALGISLPRTSELQATVGVAVPSLAQAQPGDLVFFPGSDGTATSPGHVGIYIGNGEMIDAPYTGTDVQIDAVGNPTEIRRVTGLAGSSTYAASEQVDGASPSSPDTAIAATGGTATGGTGTATYNGDFQSAASSYGVPEQLLSAVAETESDYQPGAVSNAGAEGLMQLMPSTAASLGVNPWDPTQAVSGAAKLLSSYYNQYGSWSLSLAAYNAGPGAVDEYSGIPPYPQTQAYVQTVLSRAGMEDS